jgi:hypothetical protein
MVILEMVQVADVQFHDLTPPLVQHDLMTTTRKCIIVDQVAHFFLV